jgi:anti-sigma B factor antagonist
MSLNYAVRQVGDVAVLDLSGRVSLTETPYGPGGAVSLHELVRNAVNTASKKILINLRDVTYIDSSGLGELVSCSTTASNQGADMKVCNANKRVNDLLVITSLKLVLSVYPDEEAGLQAFAQLKKGSSAA